MPSTVTLVLDLDETLVHATMTQPPRFDFSFEFDFRGKPNKVL